MSEPSKLRIVNVSHKTEGPREASETSPVTLQLEVGGFERALPDSITEIMTASPRGARRGSEFTIGLSAGAFGGVYAAKREATRFMGGLQLAFFAGGGSEKVQAGLVTGLTYRFVVQPDAVQHFVGLPAQLGIFFPHVYVAGGPTFMWLANKNDKTSHSMPIGGLGSLHYHYSRLGLMIDAGIEAGSLRHGDFYGGAMLAFGFGI